MENTFSRSNKENLDAEAAAKAEVSKVESARLNVARQIQRELNKLNKEAARDAEAEIKKQEARDKEDLERLAAFEQAKKQLKEDLALEAAETEEERELLKAEQDAEKKALEFENMILEAEERTELEALLLEQKEATLQEIRDKYAEDKAKKQAEADKKEIKAKTKMSKLMQTISRGLASALQGILGDSLAGQIAGIAVDAAIQSASVGIKTSAAQAANIAQATAALPPPLRKFIRFYPLNSASLTCTFF
jgi:hypothetical protein